MIKIQEIPLLILMCFTLVYATIGNPDSPIWSGLYFFTNYLTLLFLYKGHKSKTVRLVGISLSISILIFIALKYLVGLQIERYYTLVTFLICLVGIIKLEQKK